MNYFTFGQDILQINFLFFTMKRWYIFLNKWGAIHILRTLFRKKWESDRSVLLFALLILSVIYGNINLCCKDENFVLNFFNRVLYLWRFFFHFNLFLIIITANTIALLYNASNFQYFFNKNLCIRIISV